MERIWTFILIIWSLLTIFFVVLSPWFFIILHIRITVISGKRARKLYKEKREDAAAVKIQRNLRRQLATRSYNGIRFSAVTLQSGLRAMAARSEFRSREQNKAATALQVNKWLSFPPLQR